MVKIPFLVGSSKFMFFWCVRWDIRLPASLILTRLLGKAACCTEDQAEPCWLEEVCQDWPTPCDTMFLDHSPDDNTTVRTRKTLLVVLWKRTGLSAYVLDSMQIDKLYTTPDGEHLVWNITSMDFLTWTSYRFPRWVLFDPAANTQRTHEQASTKKRRKG